MSTFLVPSILACGRFDSRVKFGEGITVTKDRPVNYFELELYTEAEGCSYLNGREYKITHGSLLCAKPGSVRHSRLPFSCYYLFLAPGEGELSELLGALPEIIEIENLQLYTQLFLEIIRASFENNPANRCLQYSGLLRLLYQIQKDSAVKISNNYDSLIKLNRQALNESAAFLRQNFAEAVTLKKLAITANLSTIYFHKLFSAYFGKTPYDYLLEIRIAAAKDLLLTTEKGLNEIAGECGFSTQSYFHRRFKACIGQTPREYRNQYLVLREA